MRIVISGTKTLYGLDIKQREEIRKACRVWNTAKDAATRAGAYTARMPDWIDCWKYSGDGIAVPREFSVPFDTSGAEIVDKRITHGPVLGHVPSFNGVLNPAQDKALRSALQHDSAVICAPTGAGKTVIGLAWLAERLKYGHGKALIIVHTKELLEQWKDRAEQFLGIEITKIGPKSRATGMINILCVQSALHIHSADSALISHVIVDECHRVPAQQFVEALERLPGTYRLGLSATPYRRDGKDNMITWHLGPIAAQIPKAQLVAEQKICRAEVVAVPTSFATYCDGQSEYSRVVSEATKNLDRNSLIASRVCDGLGGGVQLVLTDRKAHVDALRDQILVEALRRSSLSLCSPDELLAASLLNSENVRTLTGSLSLRQREKVVADARSGSVQVLIATAALVGEGFDLPGICVVHLATPMKYKGRLLQCVGRALRPAPGKDFALVYDYVDSAVPVLRAQWFSRLKVYTVEPGFEVRSSKKKAS